MSEIGQKLIAAVRARAAANPDKVYQAPPKDDEDIFSVGCVNVYKGKGSCIVGCGALDAGLITPAYEHSADNGAGVYSLNRHLDSPLDRNELFWLSHVQDRQDSQTPWGQAVATADERYPQPSDKDND